jgi:hypothetical protein
LRLHTVDRRWRKYDHRAQMEWYLQMPKHSDNNQSQLNRLQVHNGFAKDPVSYLIHGINYSFGVQQNTSVTIHLAIAAIWILGAPFPNRLSYFKESRLSIKHFFSSHRHSKNEYLLLVKCTAIVDLFIRLWLQPLDSVRDEGYWISVCVLQALLPMSVLRFQTMTYQPC